MHDNWHPASSGGAPFRCTPLIPVFGRMETHHDGDRRSTVDIKFIGISELKTPPISLPTANAAGVMSKSKCHPNDLNIFFWPSIQLIQQLGEKPPSSLLCNLRSSMSTALWFIPGLWILFRSTECSQIPEIWLFQEVKSYNNSTSRRYDYFVGPFSGGRWSYAYIKRTDF